MPYRLDAKPTPASHPLRRLARAVVPSPHPLPPECAWLSGWVKGIRDQGQEGSCTGHGTAGAVEVAYGSLHRHPIPEQLSPAYVYARARMMESTFPADNGAVVGDAVLAAHLYGVCRESVLPYREDPAEGPTPEADADAATRKIPPPLSVAIDPQAMKTALASGMPLVIAMHVGQSFFGTGPDGNVPPRPSGEPDAGSHCMYAAGYNPYRLLVVNSWGSGFGQAGMVYPTWDYVLQNVFECWALPLA